MCYLPQCYGIFHVFVSLVLSEEFSLHSNKIFWIFTPKLAKIASATPNNDFWRENSIVFTLKNERFALNVARLFDLFSNTVVHFSKKRYYPKYLLEKIHCFEEKKNGIETKALLLKNGFLFFEKCSQKGDHGVSLFPWKVHPNLAFLLWLKICKSAHKWETNPFLKERFMAAQNQNSRREQLPCTHLCTWCWLRTEARGRKKLVQTFLERTCQK